MTTPLIMTQPKYWRLGVDIVLTLLAWFIFFWLLDYSMYRLEISRLEHLTSLSSTLIMFAIFVGCGVFNGIALIVWAKYNQHRFYIDKRTHPRPSNPSQVAKSIHLSLEQLAEYSAKQISYVQVDNFGVLHPLES